MLDVGHRFLEELAHMLIVQAVEDLPSGSTSADEPQMTKDAELMRYSRCLHPNSCAELGLQESVASGSCRTTPSRTRT